MGAEIMYMTVCKLNLPLNNWLLLCSAKLKEHQYRILAFGVSDFHV